MTDYMLIAIDKRALALTLVSAGSLMILTHIFAVHRQEARK